MEDAPTMSNMEEKSEIARIREQIALEYEAAQQGVKGLAATSRHDFIVKRQQNIWHYTQELAVIVGEAEATRIMCESCFDTTT
jgi:hypothetical protein